jgi:hypothetical protein
MNMKAFFVALWAFLQTVQPVLGTIIAACIGALVVIWQISRQARNAIRQNRENEALKLKLEVYKDIIGITRGASHAAGELANFVRRFHMNLALARQTQAEVNSYIIPGTNPDQLTKQQSHLSSAVAKVLFLTETWLVIDKRMDIFRISVVAAKYDVDAALQSYFEVAYHAMPIASPVDEWTPPNAEVFGEIERRGNALISSLTTLQSYIFDFLREMQTVLIGPMFDQRIPAHMPPDPSAVVVRLDRYDQLMTYFNQETNWGRNQAQIESRLRSGGPSGRRQ